MAPHPKYPGIDNLTFDQIGKLNYKEQAIWFLNGFFDDGLEENAEKVWEWHKLFVELDRDSIENPRGEEGSELDMIMAARFLEKLDETMLASERKEALSKIDVNNDGKMALIEYLIFRFSKGVDDTVKSVQGKTQEIAACQATIDKVLAMMPEIEASLKTQRDAAEVVESALSEVKTAKKESGEALEKLAAAEAELKGALDKLANARAELEAAIEEFKRQEDALAAEITRLEKEIEDPKTGVVKRGMASNKLSSLRGEDPLPLRKAKITQEAALRAMQRKEKIAAKAEQEAAAKTDVHRAKVEELEKKEADLAIRKQQLQVAISELEASYSKMEERLDSAHKALEKLKTESRAGLGAAWWMERELYEADTFLPTAKQKFDHSRPFVMSVQCVDDDSKKIRRRSWIGD